PSVPSRTRATHHFMCSWDNARSSASLFPHLRLPSCVRVPRPRKSGCIQAQEWALHDCTLNIAVVSCDGKVAAFETNIDMATERRGPALSRRSDHPELRVGEPHFDGEHNYRVCECSRHCL